MKPKEFKEVNVRIAEHQDEYVTLPAYFNKANGGSMAFCMELSEEEINRVRETGEIWIELLTFGQPMQPISLSVLKEDIVRDVIIERNEP